MIRDTIRVRVGEGTESVDWIVTEHQRRSVQVLTRDCFGISETIAALQVREGVIMNLWGISRIPPEVMSKIEREWRVRAECPWRDDKDGA